MEDYEKLLDDIRDTVSRISDLYDFAYAQYSHAVDEVLANRLTDEKQIDHLLDGIIDFGDDLRFIELSKKLCRHIFYHYPQLVGDFVSTFRALFEDKEETVRLGRIPFDYTEEDLEEARRMEKMMNDDLCDI